MTFLSVPGRAAVEGRIPETELSCFMSSVVGKAWCRIRGSPAPRK